LTAVTQSHFKLPSQVGNLTR